MLVIGCSYYKLVMYNYWSILWDIRESNKSLSNQDEILAIYNKKPKINFNTKKIFLEKTFLKK